MEFKFSRLVDTNEWVYMLKISDSDISMMKLRPSDQLLLDDVNPRKDVTIADRLLALELMARRIQEAQANATN